MSRAVLTPHDRASVLIVGRRIAADLATRALDPASGLRMADRVALAALVMAVDIEACRQAGVEPPTAELRAALSAALADVEQSQGGAS